MKRKIVSILTALALCLSLLPITTWAEEPPADGGAMWTDGLTAVPEGWNEDESGTITISTPEALAWLAVCVNGLNGQEAQTFKEKTIILDRDIDLQGKNWTPIGKSGTSFEGNFDGRDHTISNMMIHANNGERYIGLFGQVHFNGPDMTAPTFIRSIRMENVDIVTEKISTFSDVGELIG